MAQFFVRYNPLGRRNFIGLRMKYFGFFLLLLPFKLHTEALKHFGITVVRAKKKNHSFKHGEKEML